MLIHEIHMGYKSNWTNTNNPNTPPVAQLVSRMPVRAVLSGEGSLHSSSKYSFLGIHFGHCQVRWTLMKDILLCSVSAKSEI